MKNKILFLLATLVAATASAQPFLVPSNPPPVIQLAWNANPDPTVTGYYIYEGTNSGQYTVKMPASTNNSTLTVSNLLRGVTNYFNITATNSAGLESVFGGEVSYKAPLPPASPSLKPIVVLTAMFSPTLLNPSWSPVGTLPLLADQQAGFYKTSMSLPK